jgi:uncharacterized membrane protein
MAWRRSICLHAVVRLIVASGICCRFTRSFVWLIVSHLFVSFFELPTMALYEAMAMAMATVTATVTTASTATAAPTAPV